MTMKPLLMHLYTPLCTRLYRDPRCRLRVKGFALLELMIATLIAVLMAVWASNVWVNRMNDAAAHSAATWMKSVQSAAQHYLVLHGQVLREATHGSVITGFEDWSRPAVDELQLQGLLPQGFPSRFDSGTQMAVQVLRSGVCPGHDCVLEALIYTQTPLTPQVGTGGVEQMQAQWTLAAQGEGASVSASQPGRIIGARFNYPNPPVPAMDPLPVGSVAMAVTVEQTYALDFLRVKDSRDPQFQASVSARGIMATERSLRANQTLWLGERAFAQSPCPEDGQITREYFGGLLVCRGMRWVSAGGTGGGGFSVNTVNGCALDTMNPVTGACTCPGSYTAVRIADSGPDVNAGRTRGYVCVG